MNNENNINQFSFFKIVYYEYFTDQLLFAKHNIFGFPRTIAKYIALVICYEIKYKTKFRIRSLKQTKSGGIKFMFFYSD